MRDACRGWTLTALIAGQFLVKVCHVRPDKSGISCNGTARKLSSRRWTSEIDILVTGTHLVGVIAQEKVVSETPQAGRRQRDCSCNVNYETHDERHDAAQDCGDLEFLRPMGSTLQGVENNHRASCSKFVSFP